MSRGLLATSILSALLFVTSGSPLRANPDAPTTSSAPQRVALIVGVNKYLKSGFRSLQFAEADVIAVGAELTKLGFQVTTLTGSGKGNLQAPRRTSKRPSSGSSPLWGTMTSSW